ncbi:MAG: hypothetical protein P8P42_02600, partial [Gammaproteobacteria bacterium]|nr:hypothetical protein [Gammaproteobacteria bacterium]
LERTPDKGEVGGSNPPRPTNPFKSLLIPFYTKRPLRKMILVRQNKKPRFDYRAGFLVSNQRIIKNVLVSFFTNAI